MRSSIYVKRQSFEVRLNSVISFVFVAFCQPRILRYSARDVTDIFAIAHTDLGVVLIKREELRFCLLFYSSSIFEKL